jgi:hypothetical protein
MLSRFVKPAAIAAAIVFSLQTTSRGVSANDGQAGRPVCCVANAACCQEAPACCVSAVPEPQAGGLPRQNTVVHPTQAAIARLTCCLKNAYCCQVRRPCCRPAASETAKPSAAVGAPAANPTAVVAKPTCCAKRAYCCAEKQRCCR